jgi:hypothetical protein
MSTVPKTCSLAERLLISERAACMCQTLTTMKFVLHRFTYRPFLCTSYQEAAKEMTLPKSHYISQTFPSAQFFAQGYQTRQRPRDNTHTDSPAGAPDNQIKISIFYDVTPCSPVVRRIFGGTYCLHLQGQGQLCLLSASCWLFPSFTLLP